MTPLHAGSGSDLGVVDMPIQRESHTSFPKIEASSLKGSIRSEFSSLSNIEDIFGSDNGEKAGQLGFSDAKILFFPVKSVKGVFAYVTCPMVLKRLAEDLKLGDTTNLEEIKIPTTIKDDECIVFENNVNSVNSHVILEEYSFKIQGNKLDDTYKIPEVDKSRLVIISDDNFIHFVKNSTEVITRIKIGKDGVVDKEAGALFTEEYLPSESVMYALALGEVSKLVNETPTIMQIGGNTTLGKGIVELSIGVQNGN
ncbi:MAG: type III-B CRISPR module RAMP protein Cmr4 [Epsilonproteobacteria bacterium]|nr:type III-B CRISPR module RAMP protein Cmr4 [Campylobacterota bacterium]